MISSVAFHLICQNLVIFQVPIFDCGKIPIWVASQAQEALVVVEELLLVDVTFGFVPGVVAEVVLIVDLTFLLVAQVVLLY